MHKGWKNILSGIGIILIGLIFGGSVFLGNADALDWIFDVLGIVFIIVGIVQLATQKEQL